MIISEERVRARRAALVAQMAEAQQQYAQLERNLDAMQGGLQELDNLLAEPIDELPAP
jgi:outer membrane protein TolC